MTRLIVITGEAGSGKSAVAKLVAEAKSYAFFEMSDFAKAQHQKNGFAGSLIEYVQSLFENGQETIIVKQAIAAISTINTDVAVVSGIRFASEYQELIRVFEDIYLVFLKAPSEVRLSRINLVVDLERVGQAGEKRFATEQSWGGFAHFAQVANLILETSDNSAEEVTRQILDNYSRS